MDKSTLASAKSKKAGSSFLGVLNWSVVLVAFFFYYYYYNQHNGSSLLQSVVGKLAFSVKTPVVETSPLRLLQEQTTEIKKILLDRLTLELEDDDDKDTADEPDRYYMHHFQDHFRVTPIDHIELSPEVEKYYKDYKLTADPYYLENKEECDFLNDEFAPYLNRSSGMFDERFYIQWSDVDEHYSLFAKIDMPTKVVLGSYAGVLRPRPRNIEDAWRYRGNVIGKDGEPMDLVVDGRFKGNWFRFLRTTEQKGNVEAVLVPHIKQNVWHVVFQAKRSIQANEELLMGSDELD